MATRFMYKAFLIAALAVVLSLLLGATTTASRASSGTARAIQLDPPAAPSHLRIRTTRIPDPEWPHGYYTLSGASWRDNSSNEDGFIVEEWRRNQGGEWTVAWSYATAANITGVEVDGGGPNYRFRVKAFNAAGESAWSSWAR